MAESATLPSVVLVGAPGSGKTVVGRLLAEHWQVPFTDAAMLLEARAGKSITDVFLEDGPEAYRDLERQVSLEALSERGVVSLGSAAVLDDEVSSACAGRTVVWLEVNARQASRRVGLTGSQPLPDANLHSTMVRLMNERAPFYERVATVRVDTSPLTPEEVCRAVVDAVGEAEERLDSDEAQLEGR